MVDVKRFTTAVSESDRIERERMFKCVTKKQNLFPSLLNRGNNKHSENKKKYSLENKQNNERYVEVHLTNKLQ